MSLPTGQIETLVCVSHEIGDIGHDDEKSRLSRTNRTISTLYSTLSDNRELDAEPEGGSGGQEQAV